MTESSPPLPSPTLSRWLRRAGRFLIGSLVLIAPLLAFELLRWSSLPADSTAITETGPEAGSQAAQAALEAVSNWLQTHPVTGVTVCFGAEGEVPWCAASGYADLEEQRPLESTTSMRIGSVSKTVSGILLANLDERGLVDLDRPIGELPDFDLPPHLSQVTLRQLASHTAGVRHYDWRFGLPPHETWSRTRYQSVDDSLQQFLDDPLLFSPGTDFRYSTHGYTLLGAALVGSCRPSIESTPRKRLLLLRPPLG